MREQQWILIDNFKRKIFIKNELKKIILKSLIKNSFIFDANRYLAHYRKNKISRFKNVIQQHNRCFISGRRWYVLKITRLSRFKFRDHSYSGLLPGFSRASW